MNLIIDVGNSLIKVAVFKADKVVEVAQTVESDFLKKISNIFENHPSIAKIMVSSVGKLSDAYIEGLSVFAPVLILNKNSKLPFKNEYATPNTLGVDRIALVAAAFYAYPQKNCLVIDAGKGVYKGGAISPGIRMRYKAMHAFTAKLPLIDSFGLENFIGNSTETCMISGVINGTVNEIEATILQYQRKFKDLTVILTGGDSHFLSKRLKSSIFAHPNFLMEGVNYILELNKH